jgi:hypothetical protein
MEGLSEDCIFLIMDKAKIHSSQFFLKLACIQLDNLIKLKHEYFILYFTSSLSRFKFGCKKLGIIRRKEKVAIHHSYLGYRAFNIPACIIERGDFETFKYARKNCFLSDIYGAYCLAAKFGRLEIMKYLDSKRYPGENLFGVGALENAAENGHLDIVKYMVNLHNITTFETIAFSAIKGEQLEVLQYVYNKCLVINEIMVYDAIKYGKLEILKYLLEHADIPSNVDLCGEAANRGYVSILKYLHENGHPWKKIIYRYILYRIYHNWLDMPRSQQSTEYLPITGYYQCLRYAQMNGLPFDIEEHIGYIPGLSRIKHLLEP